MIWKSRSRGGAWDGAFTKLRFASPRVVLRLTPATRREAELLGGAFPSGAWERGNDCSTNLWHAQGAKKLARLDKLWIECQGAFKIAHGAIVAIHPDECEGPVVVAPGRPR